MLYTEFTTINLRTIVFVTASLLVLSACGGSSNPPEPLDTTAPSVSFNPSTLTVESETTTSSTVSATDSVGVTSGPDVQCDNGGSFVDNTFTAPAVSTQTTITCTATASDAAGNQGSAILTATVNPSNSSPQAFISKSIDEVNEGRIFTLDASESTDSDGDVLTYNWFQVRGPVINIANPATPVQNLTAGNVTEDSQAEFTVEISDGTETVSENITILVKNFSNDPKTDYNYILEKTFPFEFTIQDEINGTNLIDVIPGNGISFNKRLSLDSNFDLVLEDVSPFPRSFSDDAKFVFESFNPYEGWSNTSRDVIVYEESSDRVSKFNVDSSENYTESWSITVDNPCAVFVDTSIENGVTRLYVGQRNAGFSVVNYDNDDGQPEIFLDLNDGKSICALGPVGYFPNIGPPPSKLLLDLVAIDTNTNMALQYTETDTEGGLDTVRYQLKEEIALFDTPEKQNLVMNEFMPPRSEGLVASFTDGSPDGLNLISVVTLDFFDFDDDRDLELREFDTKIGKLSDALVSPVFEFIFNSHHLILSPNSPDAAILSGGVFDQGPPTIPSKNPKFVEIGVGATHGFLFGDRRLVVIYGDLNEGKIFRIDPP